MGRSGSLFVAPYVRYQTTSHQMNFQIFVSFIRFLFNFHVICLTAALGFLVYEERGEIIEGNMGIRDQQYALLWVQRNIAKFGGDSTMVWITFHICLCVLFWFVFKVAST